MREKKERISEGKKKRTIFVVILVALVGGFGYGFLVGHFAYTRGYRVGTSDTVSRMNSYARDLAAAVSGKNEFKEKIEEIFSETPANFSEETIPEYKNKLEELKNSARFDEVKEKLDKLISKVEEFSEVYSGGDNSAINEKFSELREFSVETAKDIQAIFNGKIRVAADQLDVL